MKKILLILVSFFIILYGCKKEETKENISNNGLDDEITVLTSITGNDKAILETCFDAFEEENGVTIRVEGTGEFVNLLYVRVESGNPPDVAIMPQPGVIRDFFEMNKIVPLNDELIEKVKKNYSEGWQNIMQIKGYTL